MYDGLWGYTILRDLDQEARQAEFAAIDSLVTAPDLTISDIDYEYAPPRERSSPLTSGHICPRDGFTSQWRISAMQPSPSRTFSFSGI